MRSLQLRNDTPMAPTRPTADDHFIIVLKMRRRTVVDIATFAAMITALCAAARALLELAPVIHGLL